MLIDNRRLLRYFLILLLWSGILLASAYAHWVREKQHMLDSASSAALATINKDISFRHWATDHGGIYIKPSEYTPSNPFLIHPDRDVVTTDGQRLTLMNPAYMLRDMQERSGSVDGTKTELVSLKPLNPANAPDSWQAAALKRFEKGETLIHEINKVDGDTFMRVIYPFELESMCLQCHSHQGYQVGDIRGGISTSLPLEDYLQLLDENLRFIAITHMGIWSLGSVALFFAFRREEYHEKLRDLTNQELRLREDLYRSVTNNGQALIWLSDVNKQCVFFNEVWLKFTGRTLEQEYGIGWLEGVHEDDRERCMSIFTNAFDNLRKFSMIYRLRRHDGEYRWILDEGAPRFNSQEEFVGYIGHCLDITERKLMEDELQIAAKVFESQEGVFITDEQGIILRVNREFEKITGWPADQAVGKTPRFLKSGKQDQHFYQRLWESLKYEHHWHGEIINRRRNGDLYPQELSITAVTNDNNKIRHYVATLRDISANKKAEHEIEQLAFYDSLTGLPNRRLLLDRLKRLLLNSKRSNIQGALLMIDLDNFKQLNDSMGHQQGDQLLIQVAHRLEANLRKGDTVARLGGDEFVILLENLGVDSEQAAQHAENAGRKLLAALSTPFNISNQTYPMTASIGIALFHPDATTDSLITQADIAMYQAKNSGRNQLCFFDTPMQVRLAQRVELEVALRHALKHHEFLLHYQPQVDANEKITGAEALIRWQHPDQGLLSPIAFIDLAEETGLIIPIGEWVLTEACQTLTCWANTPESAELTLSVNVSARQIMQPDFVDLVKRVINKTNAPASRLKIELTESVLVDNVDEVGERMSALQALGIHFSIDDFGTGYSSLIYLKRLPISQLKIDQSFVKDILVNAQDAAITRSVIALSHGLELEVIAEGVETLAHLKALEKLGCDAYQGYHFGRPMPLEEFKRMLKPH